MWDLSKQNLIFCANMYIFPQFHPCCYNPSLGLVTKAKACKVVGREGSPKGTFHAPERAKECEGMNPHTPK
jgi:hypothetical protein